MSFPALEPRPTGRRFWLRFAILWLALGLGLRVFIVAELPEEPLQVYLTALLTGFASDAQSLALAFAWLSIGFLAGARLARLWLGISLALICIVFIAEIFYWLEFQSRLDRLVFHYLNYPREVIQFLEEQFFLSLFTLPFGLLIWLLTRWMGRDLPDRFNGGQRALFAFWIGVGALVLAFGTPGPPGHSRHLNQLASNGYLGVLGAARLDETRWQGAYWAPPANDRPEAPNSPPPAGQSSCRDRLSGPGFRHLLLVIEESFGGRFWWDLENRTRYMPSMQALAERGLHFDSIYATGSRTTRGLEAILNGYPPLPGMALTQRPGFESLPSLPRELAQAGFHTIFVYGGWPDFSDFFRYWRGIGFQEMLSRYDFEDRWFETSWGVPDELLFERSLEEMDRLTDAHDRVMLATLTVTNHRPFDFPDERVAFAAEERRQEYAIAYADWALGELLREAQRRAWFADTLIVVVADHGPLLDGPALVPANSYRVPLLLYNPSQIAPAQIDWHGSTMSLPLTLLDCLGLKPTQGFRGASLLAGGDGIAPVEHNYHVGLLAPDRMTLLVRGGGLLGWRYDGRALRPAAPDLNQARQAEALFRKAHGQFYGAPLLLP